MENVSYLHGWKGPELRNAVICIGNLLRADDGAGIHAARRLRDERPDLEVVDLHATGIEVLEFIRGRDNVVIVDAILTGAKPGNIHRIAPDELASTCPTSSHSLSLYSVLKLGQQLYGDEMPKKLVLLAVEGEDFDSFSSELTRCVQSAIPKLIEKIRNEFKEINN